MDSLRNRRTVRTVALGVAWGLLMFAPVRIIAQDTTAVPHTLVVKKGDTLWELAAKYLSDPFRWTEIYRLNTDVIQDPHWLYAGELLKLPGFVPAAAPSPIEVPVARVAAGQLTPPTPSAIGVPAVAAAPLATPSPSLVSSEAFRRKVDSVPAPVVPSLQPAAAQRADTSMTRPAKAIAYDDFLRAPWVDRRQGPPVWGRILGAAGIPGIDPARQRARFQMNDLLLIAPPTGSVAPEHELYLAYHDGPLLEDIGQIVVPTGVVEVIRPPLNGDAAIASIVQMFGEVQELDRLMPYDSSGVAAIGLPTPIRNGIEGAVRWVADEPVLPLLPSYIVLSFTLRDGVKIGDRVELYQGRQQSRDVGIPSIPEVHVGYAEIVRVTPFATTALITAIEQPKVVKGTLVRITAKMQ